MVPTARAMGGGKGVDESGECDAEDGADGSCDASALAVGDDDEASPPEKVGIEGETAAAAVQEAECVDKEPRCAYWAAEGECEENPDYMLVECQLSCNSCPEPLVLSPEEARLMEAVAKYGVAQRVERKKAPETLDVIRRTVRYMENVIHTNPTYDLSEEMLAGCTNREDLCAFRAAIGGEHMMWLLIRDGGFTTFSSLVSSTPHSECEQYPTYMKTNCAPSCRTCGFITDPPLEPESPRFPDDFVHPCQDDEPRCPVWAREGECKANPGYMLQSCAGSCGICQLPQEEDADADAVVACVDKYDRCDEWEKEGGGGGCSVNPVWMLSSCKYSCWECVDEKMDRKLGVDEVIIAKKLSYQTMNLGVRQLIRPISDDENNPMTSEDQEKVIATIRRMDHYAKHVMSDPSFAVDTKTKLRCRNDFRMCAEWASRGLCNYAGQHDVGVNNGNRHAICHYDGNELAGKDDILFMMNMCPLACGMCHELDSFHKCAGRRHPNARPSFQTGELNSFFADSAGVGGGWATYDPLFVSYPDAQAEENGDDPYVVVFKNFLSSGEADHLQNLASVTMFAKNQASSATSNDATMPNRLYDSVGGVRVRCHDDDRCSDNEIYQRIMRRIAVMANTSISHLEPMEVVRVDYSNVQRQNEGSTPLRHNFEVSSLWKPAGPRVLSFSFFLSNVEEDYYEGGGLGFPLLDWLHIQPERGIAVMFPNVKSNNLWEPEPMTNHDFFPLVLPGDIDGDESAFVATVHIRLHNWTDADIRGCA
ncbi:hypothetical protein ACHAW5_001453 [Stephanodiscus triporus]|uniref:ShKT domain-containing protein n=1 Tax=Stephanodiscus triporus TaxID=2934178 RepID=A0ABD3N8Y1_9STRA